VPNTPVIDRGACLHFRTGGCQVCAEFCDLGAIDFTQQDETIELEVGSIILAPGFECFDPSRYTQYRYAAHPNVVTSIEFERILAASGPYQGKLLRPSDEREPKKIAWLQCVGSWEIHHCDHGYCSSVCCMYAIKDAMIAKEHSGGDLDCAIFNMDIRTFGKGYEQFYQNAKAMGVEFVRGKVASIREDEQHNPIVKLELTEEGRIIERTHDLVVLSTGMIPNGSLSTFGLLPASDGFIASPAINATPSATQRPGVFVTGTAGGPMDIVDSIITASAAASDASAYIRSKTDTPVETREVEYA